MQQLRKRMMQDLELAGYAESTRSKYLSAVGDFAKFHWRSPADMGQAEVRAWAEYLTEHSEIGSSRLRLHFAALRFLYTKTLGRDQAVSFLSWPSVPQRLPVVLSLDEVQRLLDALTETKYRVFFTTIYATGLRVTEACLLETRDIDAARGVIHVRHGKGNKERLVGLPPCLLAILRAYWKCERPTAPWLFTSKRGTHLRADTARRAIKHARDKANLDKRVTPHVLRHSFASYLLDAGTDLRIIQMLLGHASITSTTRYARVSTKLIAKASNPLDELTRVG